MGKMKSVNSIIEEDCKKINDCLLKFDGYIRNVTRQPSDENVALYEHWVECMGDIEGLITEDFLRHGTIFSTIKDDEIAISFDGQEELESLVDALVDEGYRYGTTDDFPYALKKLGVLYFAGDNYITLDRSHRASKYNYVSAGLGRNIPIYKFSDIIWN